MLVLGINQVAQKHSHSRVLRDLATQLHPILGDKIPLPATSANPGFAQFQLYCSLRSSLHTLLIELFVVRNNHGANGRCSNKEKALAKQTNSPL